MFRLFKSGTEPAAPAPVVAPPVPVETARTILFVGLSEGAIVEADMVLRDRLSDMLNRRVALPVTNCVEAPLGACNVEATESSRNEIDPYEFLLVFTTAESTPDYDRAAKMAHRLRKLPRPVWLEVGPFVVSGMVHLFPKVELEELLGRGTELFLPVTDAEVQLDGRRLGAAGLDTVLINRNDLHSIRAWDEGKPSVG